MSKLLLDIRAGVKSSVPGWLKTYIIQREDTESTIKAAAEVYPVGVPCILDIEKTAWKLPQTIDKYIQLIEWFREIRPEVRIGYYSLMPNGQGYWVEQRGKEYVEEWKQKNAAMGRTRNELGQFVSRGLVDVVDFVCPSLYAPYIKGDGAWDHKALWIKFAARMIEAARMYQKQVYPFVWLRANSALHGYAVRDKELFKSEIQFCLDNADGVVIWDFIGKPNATQCIADTEEVMRSFTVGK